MNASHLLIVFIAFIAFNEVRGCAKGDAECFCEGPIGGTYKVMKKPFPAACRVYYMHQGIRRYVHIYLPAGYDGVTPFPLWVELHGVFWATMGGVIKQVDGPVNGTDVIPHWDKGIEQFGDQVIMAYPQSMGDAGTGDESEGQGEKFRQFWSIPFWRCSVNICQPKDRDDIGFIEKVFADLPTKLTVAPGKYYLAGESAGGMMVEALLCQSPAVVSKISAAVNILGGVGADYALGANCSASPPIRYMHLHGMEDPSITYDKRILVDEVMFLSAVESAKHRAQRNGCTADDAGPMRVQADGALQCTDFCEKAAGKPAAVICGIVGVGHDLDHPRPGFAFAQAWKFLQETGRAKQTSAAPVAGAVLLRESAVPAAVATGQNRSLPQAAAVPTAATRVPAATTAVPAATAAVPAATAAIPAAATAVPATTPAAAVPAAMPATSAVSVPTLVSTTAVQPNQSRVIGRRSLL